MGELAENVQVTRAQVLELEQAIAELPEQVDLEALTSHHFAPGVYVRELFIPAGVVATGKIHRHSTMNMLIQGEVKVTTDDGVQTLIAPKILVGPAGTKRAIYAITDAIWMNVHPTESTDLEEIEAEFIAPSFEALEGGTDRLEN